MDNEEFLEKYRQQHMCCPHCGGKYITKTLAAYIYNGKNPEDYKDGNAAICNHCGWHGVVHDLIPDGHLNPSDVKEIYVYDREAGEIIECPVVRVDACYFAMYEFTFVRNEKPTKKICCFDLTGPEVRLMCLEGIGPSEDAFLVSTNRKSLRNIMDSDMYMRNRLIRKLKTAIGEL